MGGKVGQGEDGGNGPDLRRTGRTACRHGHGTLTAGLPGDVNTPPNLEGAFWKEWGIKVERGGARKRVGALHSARKISRGPL